MRATATFDRGFLIARTALWLDPRRHADLGVVTDGLGEARPGRAVATPATVRFLRRNRRRSMFLPAPPHRPFAVGDVDIELVPSGVMPGSSQVVIRRRGATILYVRRILPERIGPCEPLETPKADVVLVDAPEVSVPERTAPRRDALGSLRSWVEGTLRSGGIPVVLAEPVLAAPVLAVALEPIDCEIRFHTSIRGVLRVYAALGIRLARAWEMMGPPRPGQVLILPHALGSRAALARIPGRKVALVHDGAAPAPDPREADESFVLAMSAGARELVDHVRATGASAVHLSPTTPAAVREMLRDSGMRDVRRAGPPEQVPLGP